jgi:hypothetical protein
MKTYACESSAKKEAQRRANILQDTFMVLRTKEGALIVASRFIIGTSHVQTFRPEGAR